MQVYKDYGRNNILISSKINKKNLYSISHHQSEKTIIEKFLKYKKKFTILRMGNVFGFKKYNNFSQINSNLVHSLCFSALKKKKILIRNASIQRTFVPSQIFVDTINSIIRKNFFNNSILNISYKILNLKNIAEIIQERLKSLFNLSIEIELEKYSYQKKFLIHTNQNFKLKPTNKKIFNEIDQILKSIKNI